MKKKIKSMKKKLGKHPHSKTKKISHKPRQTLEKQFVNVRCSPKKRKHNFTCYDDDDLYKLKALWNARHPDALIKSNDTREIWQSLNNYMRNTCNKESCWLKQKFVDSKISKEIKTSSFAPEAPSDWKKNPNEWLSSVDILNVMKQYEKAYPCFDFIGPSPIDFDTHKLYGECVWEELCHFSLAKQIERGKTKIGVIFNTDPHDKPGQHWMSLFINIKKRTIFFFDSVGDPAPKEVLKLVKRIKKEGLSLNPNMVFHFDENYPVEHQYGNTECGVYSLFFIIHLLEDKLTEHYFKTHILKDEYMEKFRKVYFNDDL
jgi:hypothetical protein